MSDATFPADDASRFRTADNRAAPTRSSPRHRPGSATEKRPRSSRFVNRHAPWPSCQITFNRSPRRPRKQNRWPLSGSRRSTSCTCSARHGKPFRMSVWPVASHTRTPRRDRDHGNVSSPRMIRSSISTSMWQSTTTRRPFALSISIRRQPRPGPFFGRSGTSTAGTNAGASPSRPSRYALRQANSSGLEILCRHAVAEASRRPEKLSSTIRSFSSAVHRRRRPVSTISRRLIWRLSLWLSITTISYGPANSTRRPTPGGYGKSADISNDYAPGPSIGRVQVAAGPRR